MLFHAYSFISLHPCCFIIFLAAKIGLRDRCNFGDMCEDLNAQCLGGICSCNGDFNIMGGQCGELKHCVVFGKE